MNPKLCDITDEMYLKYINKDWATMEIALKNKLNKWGNKKWKTEETNQQDV